MRSTNSDAMEATAQETGQPAAGFGSGGKPDFWIDGEGKLEKPVHIAIVAKDRPMVDAFHCAALAAGGKDNGAPGLRPHYHPNYYGAFVLDPLDTTSRRFVTRRLEAAGRATGGGANHYNRRRRLRGRGPKRGRSTSVISCSIAYLEAKLTCCSIIGPLRQWRIDNNARPEQARGSCRRRGGPRDGCGYIFRGSPVPHGSGRFIGLEKRTPSSGHLLILIRRRRRSGRAKRPSRSC